MRSGNDGSSSPFERQIQARLTVGPAADNIRLLPLSYTLGDNDVVCGKGQIVFDHVGNQRFRQLIEQSLDRYVDKSKLEKTLLITEMVNRVRQNSPSGGFVKKDIVSGRWYEVGDRFAREKVSQSFRDCLNEKYRSSRTSRKKRREDLQESGGLMKHRPNSYKRQRSSTSSESSFQQSSDREATIRQGFSSSSPNPTMAEASLYQPMATAVAPAVETWAVPPPTTEQQAQHAMFAPTLPSAVMPSTTATTTAPALPSLLGIAPNQHPGAYLDALSVSGHSMEQAAPSTTMSDRMPFSVSLHDFPSSSSHHDTRTTPSFPESKQPSTDFFASLQRAMEDCDTSGDPFEPIPLPSYEKKE